MLGSIGKGNLCRHRRRRRRRRRRRCFDGQNKQPTRLQIKTSIQHQNRKKYEISLLCCVVLCCVVLCCVVLKK
jgi:hypothetical protein